MVNPIFLGVVKACVNSNNIFVDTLKMEYAFGTPIHKPLCNCVQMYHSPKYLQNSEHIISMNENEKDMPQSILR